MAHVVAGLPADRVALGLDALAVLHARFEDPVEHARSAPWLGPAGRTSDYGARLLRAGVDRDPELSAAFVAVAEQYIVDRDLLQDAWMRYRRSRRSIAERRELAELRDGVIGQVEISKFSDGEPPHVIVLVGSTIRDRPSPGSH